MLVPRQADPYPGSGAAHDSAILALCRVCVWGGGVDILGPYPRAVGGYHFLYVTTDKFTKLPEPAAITTVNKAYVAKFLKSIICHFGVSNQIITDHSS
jgi:hypothetical protein